MPHLTSALGPPVGLGDLIHTEIFDSLSDGVYIVTPERRITFWNAAAERLTGYSRNEVVGSLCFDNILRHVDASGAELCHGSCPLSATMLSGRGCQAKIFLHHKGGHRVPVHVRALPIRADSGEIVGAIEIFSDISDISAALRRVEELEQMAYLDPLTGAGNRRFAEHVVQQRLSELVRNQWPFGVLFIDIDFFKKVNDLHGHAAGDGALKTVARTLMGSLRVHDFVARWGGEEFVVVLAQKDEIQLRDVGERLRMLVEKSSVPHGTGQIEVTVSIGGSSARPEDRLEDLVSRADRLMYRSKRDGGNRVTMEGDPGSAT